jgi:hypothetical protein
MPKQEIIEATVSEAEDTREWAVERLKVLSRLSPWRLLRHFLATRAAVDMATFFDEFDFFEAAQRPQPHVQNGLGLHVGQAHLGLTDQPSQGRHVVRFVHGTLLGRGTRAVRGHKGYELARYAVSNLNGQRGSRYAVTRAPRGCPRIFEKMNKTTDDGSSVNILYYSKPWILHTLH